MSSDLIKHISDASFDSDVLKADKPVLVDYWAEWCGPCKMIAPILDEVSKDYGGRLQIAKMNVDENRDVPGQVRHPRHPDADAVQGRPARRDQGRRAVESPVDRIPRRSSIIRLQSSTRRTARHEAASAASAQPICHHARQAARGSGLQLPIHVL